ncbi:Fus2p PWA37_002558 [Arxiozyma heterogenica]|uniref:Fus2p n=1 Tax=Arxiozyma heterogenica TaxID=278026 RepID=UPI002F191A78
MFKTSNLFEALNIPLSNTLTPIRDYENDYFHCNDNKLPTFQRVYSQSHRNRDSNRHYQINNISNKKPFSLDLSKINRTSLPQNKKTTPILNINGCDETISSSSSEMTKELNRASKTEILESYSSLHESVSDESDEMTFYQIIRKLYESEIEYIETMQMATCVYRKALHTHPKFKKKLFDPNSSDEVLLFGNIDTIASISKIFVASFNKLLLGDNIQNEIDVNFWDKLLEDGDSLKRMYDTFDIGNLFEQHLHRIKTTYLNYFVTERKQIYLYKQLQEKYPTLFQKWIEYCLTRCQFTHLEIILRRPMQRVHEWINILSDLLQIGSIGSLLSDNLIKTLNQSLHNYKEFVCHIENEISEYNGMNNKNYDYSLTPMEIIESYHNAYQDIQNSNDCNKDTHSMNNFSNTSCCYSNSLEQSKGLLNPIENPNYNTEYNNINFLNKMTLPENIVIFKNIFNNINKLRILFCKMNFFSLIDRNINNLQKWIDIERCETFFDNNILLVNNQENNRLFLPISPEYLEELKKIKKKITILKLTDFEVGIMIPLNKLLKASSQIRHNLKDLKTLKKDYIIYLKEKKTNVYDVKRHVIGKHYEQLQNKIERDLPVFIRLVYQLIELIILNYNKLMMNFFEIMSGGHSYLQKDIQSTASNTSVLHADILQQYSASRHYVKKLVRDNWQFPCDTSVSRPLRRLFEL